MKNAAEAITNGLNSNCDWPCRYNFLCKGCWIKGRNYLLNM